MKIKLYYLFLILFIYNHVNAQEKKPSLFINCTKECYQDFLQTELSYFDFVRDRFLADIQILIIEQKLSNGGKSFTLNFIVRDKAQETAETLIFSTLQEATPDDIRKMMLKNISIYLLKQLPNNLNNDTIAVSFAKRAIDIQDDIKDKWDFWVFMPGIEGFANGGTNNLWFNFNSDLTVQRVNNNSKFIAKPYYEKSFSFFKLDNIDLKGTANSYGLNLLYAKSLTQHWSAGAIIQYGHNSFINLKSSIRLAPVVEYNIFPFSINTTKQFRIAYQLGFINFKYVDTTIFDKIQENRIYQRITATLEYNKDWGSIATSIFSNAYFDNFAQNRTGIKTNLTLRLFKGLALTFEGKSSYIKDQISLLKNDLPDEAYLLGTQQLPTNFDYEFEFGIRFTFGSIYNSIVNPRFNDIE